MDRPLFLVGMMGSGKTTVGRRLAEVRGRSFCDLDARIERVFGRAVTELFAAGEAGFRAAERLALRSLLDEPGFADRGCIVATGGGVVLAAEHRAWMRAVGDVVLLEAEVDTLAARLEPSLASRPLLAAHDAASLRATLGSLWSSRESAYRDGSISVAAGGTPDEVVAAIEAQLHARGHR